MRSITFAAVWLLVAGQALAIDHRTQFERRHTHHKLHKKDALPVFNVAGSGITKRSTCEFPKGEGMVEVAPKGMNGGWAMSPDQPCKPGMYCPYACPPGQLMAQWNPDATEYKYPQSMDGGLYCDEDGNVSKPFPNKPYCYDGVGTVQCKNTAGASVAICQTVLPGNEAMLIPTNVDGEAILAVPGTDYWAKTAAHYYVNPPGVSTTEGCVWGTKDKPVGNWAPYVAGANAMDDGETFVTVGWNPIYIEPDVAFRDEMPNYGVRIECDGDCNGLPCEIDPSKHGVNEVSQNNPPGAGGANFCVVGVPKGSTATIVVFSKDGKSEDVPVASPKDDEEEEEEEDEEPEQEEEEEEEEEDKEEVEVEVEVYSKADDKEAGGDDEKEIPDKSSSYVAPSETSLASPKPTSSSSSSATATSTDSETSTSSSDSEETSSSDSYHESKKPSTSFYTTSKLSYEASATGGSYAASATGTNGTRTSPNIPLDDNLASSASSIGLSTLVLGLIASIAVAFSASFE